MFSIKVVLQDEVRRVQVSQDCGNEGSYVQLQETLRNIFPALETSQFLLTWQDEEGECVSASSDGELFEALQVLAGGEGIPRFTIKVIEETASESNQTDVIHFGITCDECGVSPIVGIRFKCTVRPDFDLCSTCEARQAQPYPMTKITESVFGSGCPRFGSRWGGSGGRGGCHGRGGFRGHHGGRGGASHGRGPFGFGPFGLGSPPPHEGHGHFGGPHHGPHGGHHLHGHGHFHSPPPPPFHDGLRPAHFGEFFGFGGPGFHGPPHHPPHGHFGHGGVFGGPHGHHHGRRGGRGGWGWGGHPMHHGPPPGDFEFDPSFADCQSSEDPLFAELRKLSSDPAVTVTAEVLPPVDGRREGRRGGGRGRFRELCRDWRDRARHAAVTDKAGEQTEKQDDVTAVAAEEIVSASEEADGVIVTAPEAVVEVFAPPVAEVQTVSEPVAPVGPTHDDLCVLWSRELSVLANMGFVDTHVLVPLLQTHLGAPGVAGSEHEASPTAGHMEGMQRVVAELLSQMGVMF